VGESAEDLLPADPALGEVDRFGWPSVSLGRCELAKSTVRPGAVVVPQVLGQQLSQVMLIDDKRERDRGKLGRQRSPRSALTGC
jgi:hypothetical protein